MSVPAKDRLLKAAIKVFAIHGFEGSSTRLLAKEAGVNISAIPYYFTGKEGLYQATLEHIAMIIQSNLADQRHMIQQASQNPAVSTEESKHILYKALGGVIRFFLGDTISPDIVRIFIREQIDPTPQFGALYDTTMRPMHEMMTCILARLAGLPFPSEEATLCAHAVIGQVIVFKTHKEAALRRLGWKSYGENEIEKITQLVFRHTDAILGVYSGNVKGMP